MGNAKTKMTYDEEFLEMSPFLRLLPGKAMDDLMGHFEELSFDFGEIIVAEGDPADSYFLLTDGRARVLKVTENGREAPLQRLRPGDGFGEIGLLSGGPRTATIRASEPTTVLRLGRNDFDEIIFDYPQMREFMQLQLQHRMLQGFLQQYTRFARTPLPILQRILQFLRPEEFKEGDVIIRENDPGGAVYIIETGRLTVYREADPEDGEKQVLAYLRQGDYFGELSLLQGMKRTATVAAATDCRLHRLAPEDWQAITEEYDELEHLVKERITKYQTSSGGRIPLDFAQTPENARRREDDDDDDEEGQKDSEKTPSRVDLIRRAKFEFIPQLDESDCGVACFAMVCRSFGKDVGTGWIRSLTQTGQGGTGAKDICRVAEQVGLSARHVKKSADRLASLPTPALLHVSGDHWVVLLEIAENKLRIADPATEVAWQELDDVKSRWSGHAITFRSTEAFHHASEHQTGTWSWLVPFLMRVKWPILGALALMVLVAFCEAALPIFAKQSVEEILSRVVVEGEISTQWILTSLHALQVRVLLLGGILIGSLLLLLFQRLLLSRASIFLDRAISEHIFERLLGLPLSYFLMRSSADLHRRLAGVREVRSVIVHRGFIGLNALCQLAVFMVLMVYYSPMLSGAFIAVMCPVYAVLLWFSGKVLRPAFADAQETGAAFEALQTEIVDGIQAVKSSAREQKFRELVLHNFLQLNKEQMRHQFNVFTFDGMVQIVWLSASIMFMWIASRMIILDQSLTVGVFVALMLLVGMSYFPVMTLVRLWADWLAATLMMRRLNEVIDWPAEQEESAGLKAAQSLQGRVELRDVSLHLGGVEPEAALANVSFAAFPGQLVCVVGRNNAGKTVLAQVLASLLRPSSGTLLYDGIPADEIRLNELRKQIGMVQKHNHIFSGTIRANIAFGEHDVDDERVHHVARLVGISEAVLAMPQGFDRLVSNKDRLVSGTLRQGIAVARALYSDPAILIMDSLTDALDVEAESTFFENLDEALEGRTVFMITKRIAKARQADLVLVMDKGHLVESGTHKDLMARRGLYYHLATQGAAS